MTQPLPSPACAAISLGIYKAIILALLLFACGLVNARAQDAGHLDGDALKAGAVAIEQFSFFLGKEKPRDDSESFLSRIENYDVTIKVDADSYTFMFIPKPYKGSHLKGGGAFYKISKADYKVIDTKRYK